MKSVFLFLIVIFLAVFQPAFSQLKADLDNEKPEISVQDFRYQSVDFSDWVNEASLGSLETGEKATFFGQIRQKPGLAFLSSAIVPGLGQAANSQWWKTALFAGIEIGAIVLHFERRAHARNVEKEYMQIADNDWSVVKYAQFLQGYSQIDFDIKDVLTESGLEYYNANGGIMPTFDRDQDQGFINLSALNDLETATLYRSTGNPFSHVVPAYNSQQYYELVSKYFQFGPGWRDWDNSVNSIDGGVADMSPMWRNHTGIEEEFNDAYRLSSNLIMLVAANHIFSAFDAFFVSQLRLHRASMNSSVTMNQYGPNVNLRVSF